MIFRKDRESAGGEIDTYIGESTSVNGDLRLEGTLRVDGRIKGDISGEDVVVIIGRTGVVEGSIQARFVFAGGRVKGNITANQSIEVLATADIEGDLRYLRLTIEEGARVQGNFSRLPDSGTPEKRPAVERIAASRAGPKQG